MAGKIIRLFALQAIDWSSLAASGTLTLVLADYIDLSEWKEGELVARAHSGTAIGAGASAALDLIGFDPAFDDPGLNFEQVTPLTNASVAFNSTTAPPAMDMQPLTANFGLMGRLRLVLTQANPVVTAVINLSVDLVLQADG